MVGVGTWWPEPRKIREIEDTEGAVERSHKPSLISRSRISQLKMPGFSRLYSSILFSTSGVATLGFDPPMTPGLIEPVSWYLLRIFETHPWLTRSCREMTQGLTPEAAISMILSRMWFGNGRPLMKTPPSWFTRPCPRK